MAGKWIQKATARMKKKGTLGGFGKATTKKISAAKKKGGKAEKKAIFAENMKKIANKRSGGKTMAKRKEAKEPKAKRKIEHKEKRKAPERKESKSRGRRK